jgi:hypothetical protein
LESAEVNVVDIRTPSRKVQFLETAKTAVRLIAGHEFAGLEALMLGGGDLKVGLRACKMSAHSPTSMSAIYQVDIYYRAVLPVLEATQRIIDTKCCVGNLLHLLVMGAKEQLRVFRQPKIRRCQSIKWTVSLQKPALPSPLVDSAFPGFAILIAP